jgi:hypothetical protein
MRSAIQANRGQASILQGLPAETPETPVLISKFFYFFSFYLRGNIFNNSCPVPVHHGLVLTSHLKVQGTRDQVRELKYIL